LRDASGGLAGSRGHGSPLAGIIINR